MKVVIAGLDDEGYRHDKARLSLREARKVGLGRIVDEMLRTGARFKQVGDKIVMLMGG